MLFQYGFETAGLESAILENPWFLHFLIFADYKIDIINVIPKVRLRQSVWKADVLFYISSI